LRLTVAVSDRYLSDVIRAVDAVALRCDELSERVAQLSTITDDLARAVSEEVTELRSVVEELRRDDPSTPQSPNR
jgi:tetrahydromethanopterin S-methyltransferase subunit B